MVQVAYNARALVDAPLFSVLSESERNALQPWLQLRAYPARSPIPRSGETLDGVGIVTEGRVNVLLEDDHGREIIVEVLGPNEIVGVLGLFDRYAALQTFSCHRPCEMLYVPRRPLLECLEHNRAAAMFMARTLARRLETAYLKIGSLAHDDVYTRVVDLMLTRGAMQNGAWYVEVGSELISSVVGSSREMVSRVLKDLGRRGLVRRERRKIVVVDRERLRDWRARRRGRPTQTEQTPRQALAVAALE